VVPFIREILTPVPPVTGSEWRLTEGLILNDPKPGSAFYATHRSRKHGPPVISLQILNES